MSGVTQGYQTMDLMATFFFSVTIIEYLRSVSKSKEETAKLSVMSSIVGSFLIAAVYFGFIFLGAHYSAQLELVKPEQYLAQIANLTLGKYATIIVAITIFLSCLATSASLVRLFAEFLRVDLARKKISWHVSTSITLVISFALSLTGFAAIFNTLGVILVYIYPALITLTFSSILYKYYDFKWSKQSFWLTVLVSSVYNLI